LAPVVVGLAFLILYGLTLTAVHRFDAVSFVATAKNPDPRAWFNPHHLLYAWLARMVGRLVGVDHMVAALQAVSAVAAAGALAILTGALDRPWSIAGAALLGLSASFWVSAVETDPYALALLSVVAASACHLRAAGRDDLRWHVAAGIVAGLGTLVHQMVLLFALAYVGALATTARRAVASTLAFVAPFAVIVGAAYVAIGTAFGFFHDVPGLLRWTTSAGRTGYWGPLGRPKLLEGLYGFLYSLAGGVGGLVPPVVVRPIAVAISIAAIWGGVRYLRTIGEGPAQRAMAVLGLGSVAIFVAFILWYSPFYTPHWQFVTVPLVMLAVAATARLAGGSARRRRLVLGGGVAIIASLATLNYVRVIAPLTVPTIDVEAAFAERALGRMPAGARLVAPVGRTGTLMIERLGAEAVFVVPHPSEQGETSAAILQRLQRFIEDAFGEGRSVWVFGSLMEPERGYLTDPVFRRALDERLRRFAGDPRLVVLDTTTLRGARPL
jgi:hypothetical protein